MAETESLSGSEQNSIQQDPNQDEASGAAETSSPVAEINGLSAAQQDVLERCLHALTHAKNDSQVLAALLLVRSHTQKQKKNKKPKKPLYRKAKLFEV